MTQRILCLLLVLGSASAIAVKVLDEVFGGEIHAPAPGEEAP